MNFSVAAPSVEAQVYFERMAAAVETDRQVWSSWTHKT